MAAKRKNGDPSEPPQPGGDFELGRIARLLALIATKDLGQTERVGRLRAIGFANVEIADILGITSNHVGVALHEYNKSKTKASAKAERKKS